MRVLTCFAAAAAALLWLPAPASGAGRADLASLTAFSPLSATYVSPLVGWALGTVPCGRTQCLKLLQTNNDGASWSVAPAPPVRLQTTGGASFNVRFADIDDGWAFTTPDAGPPQAWSTHDGGQHWSVIGFPVKSSFPPGVEDIEASHGVVNAAVQVGDAVDIFTSPVTYDSWHLAGGPYQLGAGPVPAGELALQGGAGWFVQVDRVVVSGARRDPSGAWSTWRPPCSQAGGPALLEAPTPSDVDAVCTEGAWTGKKVTVDLLKSTNDGASFGPSRLLPFMSPEVAAAIGPSTVGVGTTAPAGSSSYATLEMSFDGGATWRTTYRHLGSWGWLQLGFTTQSQGLAILLGAPGSSGTRPNTMLFTKDGGRHWAPVSF